MSNGFWTSELAQTPVKIGADAIRPTVARNRRSPCADQTGEPQLDQPVNKVLPHTHDSNPMIKSSSARA